MAATVATSGFGTLFKAGNGASTEVFTTIAEVKSISGPSISVETLDATHMQSLNNYREMLPSFISGGEITLELNFLPATSAQKCITTDLAARTKRHFQIVWTNTAGTKWSFSGYYTGFTPNAAIDGVLSASVTITVTAGITIS
jgi:hypothetical protein